MRATSKGLETTLTSSTLSARHSRAFQGWHHVRAVLPGHNNGLKNSDVCCSQVHIWLVSLDRNTLRQQNQQHLCVCAVSLDASGQSASHGRQVWGQQSQFFTLARWLLFFLFVPNENRLVETFMLIWQTRLELLQRHSHTANGFSGKSHFAPNWKVSRTRSTKRRFHINLYQMTANNISLDRVAGDYEIRGFRC